MGYHLFNLRIQPHERCNWMHTFVLVMCIKGWYGRSAQVRRRWKELKVMLPECQLKFLVFIVLAIMTIVTMLMYFILAFFAWR